jgi:hypothetical protein
MRVPRVPNARERAGVSLLIVLLLLAALAVVAGLAIPAFFERLAVTLDNAAILIAKDLRTAQNYSAAAGRESLFTFDEDGLGYRLCDGQGRVLERPDQKGPFRRRFSDDGVFEGVHIEDVHFGPDRTLTFDPRGHALEAGSLRVKFQGESRLVEVEQKTGLVRIEGLFRTWYDNGH